jgi:hypothetical protein
LDIGARLHRRFVAPESSIFHMIHRRQKADVMQEKFAKAVR